MTARTGGTLADALDRIARIGEAFVAASDSLPKPKRHSHAGEAMVATLAAYARRTLSSQEIG